MTNAHMRERGALDEASGQSRVNVNSAAPARSARSGAPWVTKFGKLSIRENLVMTKRTPARPPVHTLHVSRCQMSQ